MDGGSLRVSGVLYMLARAMQRQETHRAAAGTAWRPRWSGLMLALERGRWFPEGYGQRNLYFLRELI